MSAAIYAGDVVHVGPAYRMGGGHEPDGWEGTYTVLEVRPTGDVWLARGALDPDAYREARDARDWDLAVHHGRCSFLGRVRRGVSAIGGAL